MDSCAGNCEVFKSSLRGREVIFPEQFCELAAGAEKKYPVDYSHLNILGCGLNIDAADRANHDKEPFPNVDTSSVYGRTHPVKLKMPIFSGAIGAADISRARCDGLAAGAAICGIPLLIGDDVCKIDPGLKQDGDGNLIASHELIRRIDIYNAWKDEFGDIIVQMSLEDARSGVAEFVVEKLGVETIGLKWGQGTQFTSNENKICDLDRAIELRKSGHIITPNPEDPAIRSAFQSGAIKEFERHSRLGFAYEDGFLRTVEHLREKLGAKRILLEIAANDSRELAAAMKWSSKARIDLLTIGGSGGDSGMSPCRTLRDWGIPAFYQQSMAYSFAKKLAARGEWIPDLAMAGGFATEDLIFKVLAVGAPYFRAVCMGRALMVPAFVGDNIEGVLRNSRPTKWKELPNTVSVYGDTPEQIFVTYETLVQRFGRDAMAGSALRRGSHVYLCGQVAHGPEPNHGRHSKLPSQYGQAIRPDCTDRRGRPGLRHSLCHGSGHGRGGKDPQRINK